MGSVAESVFRATSRTVMLVKPERLAATAVKDEDWYLHIPREVPPGPTPAPEGFSYS